jgi:hypothetical protein
MSYQYDVFISYRRAGGARRWVENHFAPTLTDCLADEMEVPPRVFFDSQIESGTTWPLDLGHKLARSRTLISLWSKNYLRSRWCTLELAHMLAREEELGFRTAARPGGLIAICVIHDGDSLPVSLGTIQTFEVKDQFITRMRQDSEAAENLESALRSQVPALSRIIGAAPAFQPGWATDAAARFYEAYWDATAPSQDDRPSFTRR